MLHYVMIEAGPNKGLIYIAKTKKLANKIIRTAQRRFNHPMAAHYGNDRDGFLQEMARRSDARFLDGRTAKQYLELRYASLCTALKDDARPDHVPNALFPRDGGANCCECNGFIPDSGEVQP